MTGGRGADQFQLAVGIANQPLSHITDFEPSKDFIAFNRLDVTPTDLKIQDSNDGATIFWKDQAIAVLSDIAATDMTSDSIQFGNVELAKTLQQTLDQTLPTTISPGVVAAVSTSDDKLWTGASGLSNLENNTPMNAGDRFPIASVTKTYTATVVMQLVEEGKLSLEGTLTQYLPDPMTNQIANSSQITIRQLLSHTSGINAAFQTDFTQDLLANPELAFIDRSPEETLADYVYGRPASFAPGSGLEYNSSNYFLLQEVIEEVTGSTLAKELQQRILGPLDLQNTFLAEKGNNPGGYQPSYQDVNGDGILDNLGAASITFAGGAGALVSTVEDATRFMQALFEGELLDADTFNEMVNGGVLVPEMNGGLGLGFVYLDTPDQGRQYISSGDVFGWSTQIQYFQETGTTAIAITNADTIPQEQNPNRIILNTIVTSLSSP
ncbi:MAG: beta-lactamase family protein [Leptolyngbyaceae cyanobacterium SL_5_9]|nr:beta-lactamase family protein [Leptolyngbyaceae cyanobacterium SL_5_9]